MNINPLKKTIDNNILPLVWLSLILFFSPAVFAAPDSNALVFWSASNEENTRTINHDSWQLLLNRYLNSNHPSGIHRFNYAAVTTEDQKALDVYLKEMQQLNPRRFSRTEQKAYWINLYNALTVELILKSYPVTSITKLGDSFLSFGPWDDKVANIERHDLSLNDIEHRILRPLFRDNRIHYAVNCASLSCPNLAASVYTATNTHRQLEEAARQYINHPRGVTFESVKPEESTLKVSSIYHWYLEDFGNSDQALISHLTNYAEPPLAEQLRQYDGDIESHYNWALNEP